MLLSLKYNFLFVHIAKTGGTSVRDSLRPLRLRDPWYPVQFLCSRLSALRRARECPLPSPHSWSRVHPRRR